jgi:tetratricopeptide (TPR) repeat protein
MMHRALFLVAFLALTLVPINALAKPAAKPAKPAPCQLTTTDLRTCMGVNGASAKEQIPACTKIINSGSVRHPYEADYYATRGSAYLSTRQLALALADLDKALSIRKAPEFYFERGIIYLAMKRTTEGKADLAETIRLKPEFASAYMMRGVASFSTGDYADAITDFDQAIKHQPSYYQALFARGVAKQKKGDSSGAKDIADARGMSAHVDQDLAKFGITPES